MSHSCPEAEGDGWAVISSLMLGGGQQQVLAAIQLPRTGGGMFVPPVSRSPSFVWGGKDSPIPLLPLPQAPRGCEVS